MNERQTAFVQNILDDPDENPAAAAKKAGYLKTTAEHKAYGRGEGFHIRLTAHGNVIRRFLILGLDKILFCLYTLGQCS